MLKILWIGKKKTALFISLCLLLTACSSTPSKKNEQSIVNINVGKLKNPVYAKLIATETGYVFESFTVERKNTSTGAWIYLENPSPLWDAREIKCYKGRKHPNCDKNNEFFMERGTFPFSSVTFQDDAFLNAYGEAISKVGGSHKSRIEETEKLPEMKKLWGSYKYQLNSIKPVMDFIDIYRIKSTTPKYITERKFLTFESYEELINYYQNIENATTVLIKYKKTAENNINKYLIENIQDFSIPKIIEFKNEFKNKDNKFILKETKTIIDKAFVVRLNKEYISDVKHLKTLRQKQAFYRKYFPYESLLNERSTLSAVQRDVLIEKRKIASLKREQAMYDREKVLKEQMYQKSQEENWFKDSNNVGM
tara:strand:- start:43 stop:1140 length:1098 start_codon:yes stop_codon:yes gene_type:complete